MRHANHTPQTSMSSLVRAAIAIAISAALAPVSAQPIQGDLKSVGFDAATTTRFVIREGCWFPLLGLYDKPGTEHFQGRLSVDCADLDGDRVDYIESPITVTGGAEPKRIWTYASTPYESAAVELRLKIYDDRGNLMPGGAGLEKAVDLISNDTMLIVDIGESAIVWPGGFDSGSANYLTMNWGLRSYYRPICVARLPAENLPDRWFGLEACDVVVWDEPNTDKLSIDQVEALKKWVMNGGQLVIGIGPAWSKLFKSGLAELLPITGDVAPNPTTRLNSFIRNLTNRAEGEPFKSPVVLAPTDLAAGALAPVVDVLPDGKLCNLITMRHYGSGRVIAVAARIRDLIKDGVKPEFYSTLVDTTRHTPAFSRNEGESAELRVRPAAPLHSPLLEPIEFRSTASLLLMTAFAFVAVYILLATGVSWLWLKKQSLTQLAWSVFAGFAVVGSLASLGAVSTLQGCSDRVASVSLLDLEDGSPRARGHVYFGYKRTIRDNVDVSLPGDDNYIRPLAPGAEINTVYATPERYEVQASRSLLKGVPMRATLKQFEGHWSGDVGGSVRAGLTVDRSTGRLTPDSWVQNDLPVDLRGGYVLFIDPRLQDAVRADGVPYRVIGMDVRARDSEGKPVKWRGNERVPPSVNVLVIPLGAMKPQTKITALGKDYYDKLDSEFNRWLNSGKDPRVEPVLSTLWFHQVYDWIGASAGAILRPVSFTDANWSAALLASTRNLYLHTRAESDLDLVGTPLTTDGLTNLDITHWLTRGSAVLLLQSDAPGAAMMHVDGVPIRTHEGRTLYRVRVPISYTGSPPRPTATPAGDS